jgi:hypothetical protein
MGAEPCRHLWVASGLLLRGMDSLVYRHGGGRRPQLTAKQKRRLVELLEAGPLVVGCETAGWPSVLSRGLIWREFGVLYPCQDVWTVRPHLGFSFPKARFGSAHLDTAKRCQGLLLFEDEASCAQGGSLSYTWARRGQPPAGKTRGKRKGYKVFGAMAYYSGRLCSQGLEGRFTSDSSQAFWEMIWAHTRAHLFLSQDGAR